MQALRESDLKMSYSVKHTEYKNSIEHLLDSKSPSSSLKVGLTLEELNDSATSVGLKTGYMPVSLIGEMCFSLDGVHVLEIDCSFEGEFTVYRTKESVFTREKSFIELPANRLLLVTADKISSITSHTIQCMQVIPTDIIVI